MAKQKTLSKREIKRQIAQFLASSKPVDLPQVVDEVHQPINRPSSIVNHPISQTTLAEIKKIGMLILILSALLFSLTLVDRRYQSIAAVGSYLSQILGL